MTKIELYPVCGLNKCIGSIDKTIVFLENFILKTRLRVWVL